MTKFSHEFRVKLVMEGESGLPLRTVAQKYNVSTKTLRTWVYHYLSGGVEQLTAVQGSYMQQFKLSAIECRRANDVSYAQAAADLGIPEGRTLCEWEKRYTRQGSAGLQDTMKGRPPKMPKKESKPKKPLTREEELEAENNQLRMENAYLKKIESLSCRTGKIRKEDKVRAVCELRQEFNLGDLLKLAGIPRSTYYVILKRLDAEDKYADLRLEIRGICEEHKGRYGYRRVTAELHNRGHQVNHKVVMRLMKESHLTCKVHIKKYRSYRGEVGKVAPNLINRDFYAQAPYQKLTTDITEFSLFGTKFYLSPVLDMYNGEILSYVISEKPVLQQGTQMLDLLFERVPQDAAPIMHSDQGWQYQHSFYQNRLKERSWIQSMSRKANIKSSIYLDKKGGELYNIVKDIIIYGVLGCYSDGSPM